MRVVRAGVTRDVILALGYAFKVPKMGSWEAFLGGLLANLHERRWSRFGDPRLCPVLASDPLGFLVVMPEAEPLTDREWARVLEEADEAEEDEERLRPLDGPWGGIPVDLHRGNFGRVGGRTVLVDYGS